LFFNACNLVSNRFHVDVHREKVEGAAKPIGQADNPAATAVPVKRTVLQKLASRIMARNRFPPALLFEQAVKSSQTAHN